MSTSTRKEISVSFLQAAASGNVRKAYAQHIAPDFRHHNAYFKGDAESLMRGMEQNAAQFPDKRLEVRHVIEEGDMVAVHSHLQLHPQNRGIAVVHIFRFRKDKIVELWDLGQPVPENSPNEYGMF